jgi:hypothetical protein
VSKLSQSVSLVPATIVKTVVTPAVQKDLARYRQIKVVDEATCRLAERGLVFASRVRKALLKITAPFVAIAKKSFDEAKAERTSLVTPYVELEADMRGQITTFRTRQAHERRAIETTLNTKTTAGSGRRYVEQVDGEDVIFDTPGAVGAAVTVAAAETTVPMFEYWYVTVVDARALLEGILAGTVPADIITIEQATMNRYAQEQKQHLAWPGVEVDMESRPIAADR